MLPSPAVERRLFREAAIIVAATLLVGTAANLVPGRRLPWWGQGQVAPSQGTDFNLIDPIAAEMLRSSLPGVRVLDTRGEAEMAAGHIPGAESFPYQDAGTLLTAEAIASLGTADAVIIVGASEESDIEQLLAQELRLRGLAPPHIVLGGMPAWRASGLPVEGAQP